MLETKILSEHASQVFRFEISQWNSVEPMAFTNKMRIEGGVAPIFAVEIFKAF